MAANEAVVDGMVSDPELNKLADEVGELYQADARRRDRVERWMRPLLILVGAGTAGAAQFFDTGEGAVILGLAGVALAFFGGLWAAFSEDSTPQVLEKARQAIRDAERKSILANRIENKYKSKQKELLIQNELEEDHISWLQDLYAFSGNLREFVENIHAQNALVNEDVIDSMLKISARDITALANFDGGEFWTLSIFLPQRSPDTGEVIFLKSISSLRSDRGEEQTEHRKWGVGEGVVGHCFQSGKEVIIEDINDIERSHWLNIPDHLKKKNDNLRYISFAAEPILLTGSGGQEPQGVVIATSDVADRFQIEKTGAGSAEIEPIRLLAGMLASALAPSFDPRD